MLNTLGPFPQLGFILQLSELRADRKEEKREMFSVFMCREEEMVQFQLQKDKTRKHEESKLKMNQELRTDQTQQRICI